MRQLAYLFERFPSFTQTFCYREVAELRRQRVEPVVFSIRRPADEPPQVWDEEIVRSVEHVPEERALLAETRELTLPRAATEAIAQWGRKTDFLRLHQAAYVGAQLQETGVLHVHAHFAGMAARTAFWIRRFFGISYSFTGHANDIFAPKPFEMGLGRLIEEASAVVTVSDFGAAYLREKFPAAAGKIHRIYNGIDVTAFPQATFASSPPLILSVGRLIEKKGFADLIEACALIAKRGCDFRCEIIGEGPLESQLQQRIHTNGVAGRVQLTGPQSQREVMERLAAANVFALPCVTETAGGMDNLPTVIMEAMAAGLPVVSTPVAGVPEMVQHGVTGLLVPQRDATALAAAIEQLLREQQQARSLGSSGRIRAEEMFSLARNVEQLRAILTRSS